MVLNGKTDLQLLLSSTGNPPPPCPPPAMEKQHLYLWWNWVVSGSHLILTVVSGERLPNGVQVKYKCRGLLREMGTRISRASFGSYRRLREKQNKTKWSWECDAERGFTPTPHICNKQSVGEPGRRQEFVHCIWAAAANGLAGGKHRLN